MRHFDIANEKSAVSYKGESPKVVQLKKVARSGIEVVQVVVPVVPHSSYIFG